jgi:hypothetical protein
VAQGVSLLEKREILKGERRFVMLNVLLMYQRMDCLKAQPRCLNVTVLTTPRHVVAQTDAPVIFFAVMFGRNETCAGPTSSGENTERLNG